MDSFVQFVVSHWQLWLALVILVMIAIRLETSTHVRGVYLIQPNQLVLMINQKEAQVFDLRDKEVYDKGHITGAVSINKQQAEATISNLVKDKAQPVVLVHPHDSLAIQLGSRLRQAGFEQVNVLKGGMHAWLAANLPLIKKK